MSGWGAAIDFLDENIDWEETEEAKTIVEENKELTKRVEEYREAILNALDEGMMSESATQVMLEALENE